MDIDHWLNDDQGETVLIPELGEVYVRPLTAAELSTCRKKAKAGAALMRVDEETGGTLEMCAATVLKSREHPEPIFTAQQLSQVPMAKLTHVIDAVGAVNGFDEDIEDLAGKLPTTESA